MGYTNEDSRRCRSGVLYTLGQLADSGHVYAVLEQLLATAVQLLNTQEEAIRSVLTQMIADKDIIQEEDAIYLPPFYYAESGTAQRLRKLLHGSDALRQTSVDITRISFQTGVEYDSIQAAAIQQAVASKVMVLTGGPGTGKTTTTQGIIAALKACGLRILLAAPTGRAAKRMSEATGMEAKTIHLSLIHI